MLDELKQAVLRAVEAIYLCIPSMIIFRMSFLFLNVAKHLPLYASMSSMILYLCIVWSASRVFLLAGTVCQKSYVSSSLIFFCVRWRLFIFQEDDVIKLASFEFLYGLLQNLSEELKKYVKLAGLLLPVKLFLNLKLSYFVGWIRLW